MPDTSAPPPHAATPHAPAKAPAAELKSQGKAKSPAVTSLVGLDEAQIEKLLGPPDESQDQAPGKRLSYRRKSCQLALTLFPDVETRTYRTLSYEVISDDYTDQGKSYCRNSFGAVLGAQ